MPTVCTHPKRTWHCDLDGSAVYARHRPTTGAKTTYSLSRKVEFTGCKFNAPTMQDFVSGSLAAYPDLLNRYLVAKLILGIAAVMGRLAIPNSKRQKTLETGSLETVWSTQGIKEKFVGSNPLRGVLLPTDKEQADALAIGGLRNSADSVARLSFTAAFGIDLGTAIRKRLCSDLEEKRTADKLEGSWVHRTCAAVGTAAGTYDPDRSRDSSEAFDQGSHARYGS